MERGMDANKFLEEVSEAESNRAVEAQRNQIREIGGANISEDFVETLLDLSISHLESRSYITVDGYDFPDNCTTSEN